MSPTSRPGADVEEARRAMSPSGVRPGNKQVNGLAAAPGPGSSPKSKSPLRSREDGVTGSDGSTESVSENNIRERALSPDGTRAKSPTNQDPSTLSRSISPQMQGEAYQSVNGVIGNTQQPQSMAAIAMQRNAAQRARSPSPIVDRTKPSDGVYQTGRASPTVNGYAAGYMRPGSTGNVTADLIRDLKLKEAELEGMKKREAWMRTALRSATNAGFVHADGEMDLSDPDRRSPTSEEPDVKGLANMILRLKQEHARVTNEVASQVQDASERCLEMERVRSAALQEASYYRAKLAAYENSSSEDAARVERQRITELERQLSVLARERTEQTKQVADLSSMVSIQTRIAEHAETRAAEAMRRSEALQESYERIQQENANLQDRHIQLESTLHDHKERILEHSTRAGIMEAERMTLEARLEELQSTKEQHIRTLDQARAALAATSDRTDELEAQWRRTQDQVVQLESDLIEARGELESRTAECETLRQRLTDVENSWAKSREEADQLRAFTTSSLGELLDIHRDIKSDEERVSRGHGERIHAMENESASLHKMLKEAGQRLSEAQQELLQSRVRVRDSEREHLSLKSQLDGIRSQLSSSMSESARLRKELASKENELYEKSRQASDTELRIAMFRTYFSEHGENIDEDDLRAKIGDAPARVVELENKLGQTVRVQEELERDLDQAIRRRDELESHVKNLANQLERVRSSPSSSKGDDGQWESRALEAERKLGETEQTFKTKLQQMEDDYQLAVKYVK